MYYGIADKDASPSFEPRYIDHAIMALNALGNEPGGGPDVFHLELPRFSSPSDSPPVHEWAHLVRSWLGVQWAGQFLVSTQKVYPAFYGPQSFAKPYVYTWLEDHMSDIKYIDETHMALAAMHDSENSMTDSHWSQHFHRQCDTNDMHVCSVVCDAVSQQVLNLAYRRKRARRSIHKFAGHNVPIKFCLLCPPDLVPFTIKTLTDKKDFTCSSFLPASRIHS
jgi:hypothetical protein